VAAGVWERGIPAAERVEDTRERPGRALQLDTIHCFGFAVGDGRTRRAGGFVRDRDYDRSEHGNPETTENRMRIDGEGGQSIFAASPAAHLRRAQVKVETFRS
jgi:hypothetical protein